MILNSEFTHRFSEVIRKDTSRFLHATDQVSSMIQEEGFIFKNKSLPFSLQPLVISAEESNYFKEVTEIILGSLEKLLEAYVTDPHIREFFSYYKEYEHLIMLNPGYQKKIRISRFDTIWYGGDQFKILEPNTCCPGGVVVLGKLKERYFQIPFIKEFLKEYKTNEFLCDAPSGFLMELVNAYREMGGPKHKPSIAFANYNGQFSYELSHMKKYAQDMGLEAVICDLRELKISESSLFYEDLCIDIIYNKVDQLELGKTDMQDVLTAIEKGYVCSVNSFASMFIGESKLTLALLTDKSFQEKYLTHDEVEAIRKHVPWTRKLENRTSEYEGATIDLLSFTRSNKDSLVLKIDNETRGSNVFIGNMVQQAEWDSLIEKNKDTNWVVQEYYPIKEICVPIAMDGDVSFVNKKFGIDMFMFGGKYAGVVSRISENSIINVGQGGFEQPVIEVVGVTEAMRNS
ncbi:hypothetical protein [Bacillus horti]|uniref:Glutathionylspermidine synthase pre-ATP-grasp-like domain-containing protein n=1 Tax=Caldalkalibacillus horti TaxID=77523 RepID=A0ABT9W293_9BACI|nr:hypothetical protein [Bacillus horti]MDQ0167192.1 hypothetical protein [Bacillus horti]